MKFMKQLKKQTTSATKEFRNELDVALFTQVRKPIIEATGLWVEYKCTRIQHTVGELIEKVSAKPDLYPEDSFIIKTALTGAHNFIGALGPMITAYMAEYIKTADAILETERDAADAILETAPDAAAVADI